MKRGAIQTVALRITQHFFTKTKYHSPAIYRRETKDKMTKGFSPLYD
jgi:hypothetical protein